MKTLSALILVLLTVMACAVACQGSREEAVTDAPTSDAVTTAAESEAPDEALYGWFEQGTALTYRTKFSKGDRSAMTVEMAKNEKQGFQYVLTSDIDYSGLRCEVSALTDGKGNTLESEIHVAYFTGIRKSYANYRKGFVPTALMPQDDPYQKGVFDVKAGCSKTLYVQYVTDKNTVPGTYTGVLEIKRGDEVLLTGGVTVVVWDLYYEEKTALITDFGYGFSPLQPDHPEHVPVPESALSIRPSNERNGIYADYLIENRLGISRLPYGTSLFDEGIEKYLNNPRVASICLTSNYKLEEQYAIAVENGWVDKIHFMQYDEPHDEVHVSIVLGGAKDIASKFPTTRHQNPLLNWNYYEDGKNIIDVFSEVTTLHCVKSSFYKGEIKDSLVRLQKERGDTVLWYTCGDQPANMIDLLPSVPGTVKEILFWQLYQNDIDGFLYWATTWWYDQDDIWAEGYEEKGIKFPNAWTAPTGNGVLLYWHPETNMPVSTLSLVSVRDGIEDYQLIAMAEEVLGRETVLTYVERITTSPTKFIKDAEVLMQVRHELAAALLAAKAS
ncbi:MAG: DUF4091 domain-containing protein [Clostridia bacterium]|nr:DUF4091 domain-containing protein [Clostridia bacterium]